MSSWPYLIAPARSAWPGRGRVTSARLAPLARLRHLPLDVHRLLPVHPVAVADQQRDGRAGGAAVADAGKDLGAVAFDRHPPAAAVAALAAAELRVERIDVEVEAGGHPVERDDERLAVRLAGAEKSQHRGEIVYEEIAPFGEARAILPRFSHVVRIASLWGMTHLLHDRYKAQGGRRRQIPDKKKARLQRPPRRAGRRRRGRGARAGGERPGAKGERVRGWGEGRAQSTAGDGDDRARGGRGGPARIRGDLDRGVPAVPRDPARRASREDAVADGDVWRRSRPRPRRVARGILAVTAAALVAHLSTGRRGQSSCAGARSAHRISGVRPW